MRPPRTRRRRDVARIIDPAHDDPGEIPGVLLRGGGGRPGVASGIRNGSALGAAGPGGGVGKRGGESTGQVLDADPLGGVVADGDQCDAEGLGFQSSMKPGLAGEQDVGPGAGGVVEEVVAGTAGDRNALDVRSGSPTIWTPAAFRVRATSSANAASAVGRSSRPTRPAPAAPQERSDRGADRRRSPAPRRSVPARIAPSTAVRRSAGADDLEPQLGAPSPAATPDRPSGWRLGAEERPLARGSRTSIRDSRRSARPGIEAADSTASRSDSGVKTTTLNDPGFRAASNGRRGDASTSPSRWQSRR